MSSTYGASWLTKVADEQYGDNADIVHKFGRNTAVGTSFVPVAFGGIYPTPQVGSATQLRIKAGGDANDDAAGTGAREVTLIGLDANGNEITEAIATNGISASSATTNSFIRLYRAYVSASGTYATASAGSHAASITIENSAGGTDWATIDATDFPLGQTEIAVYSVPTGKKCFLMSAFVFADSTKTTNVVCFQREDILQTAAPYTAMREVFEITSGGGGSEYIPRGIVGPFDGPCDIGFLAKVNTGTAEVDIDFELLVVDV